jgi:hypothetical protein
MLSINFPAAEDYLKLGGYIANHMKGCRDAKCKCTTLDLIDLESESVNIEPQCKDDMTPLSPPVYPKPKDIAGERELEMNAPQVFAFVERLLELASESEGGGGSANDGKGEGEGSYYGGNRGRYILLAYVNHDLLHNLFKALNSLAKAEEGHLGVCDEFMSFCLKRDVERGLYDLEVRRTGGSSASMTNVIAFHEKYIQLHDLVAGTTQVYSKFWAEMASAAPSMLLYHPHPRFRATHRHGHDRHPKQGEGRPGPAHIGRAEA